MTVAYDSPWTLEPGEFLGRRERMEIWGGAMYGGIEPSTTSPNLFLYTDAVASLASGYSFDGWNDSRDIYQYTGEGPYDDQQFVAGNKGLRDHKEDERIIRLFVADGNETIGRAKKQRYLGMFELDDALPFFLVDALDKAGRMRVVIVFRLRPIGEVLFRLREVSEYPIGVSSRVQVEDMNNVSFEFLTELIELEQFSNPSSAHENSSQLVISWRKEAALVVRFREYLTDSNRDAVRHRISAAGQPFPIYTDVFVPQTNTLYEAKSVATRESVRMAVGQLLDYRRFLAPETNLAMLIPSRPSTDLLSFVNDLDIAANYPVGRNHFEAQTLSRLGPA